MPKFLRIFLISAVVFTAFSTLARDVSPFANFQGSFARRGAVKISDGGGIVASGRVAERFHLGSTGRNARLTIIGTIRLDGATRPLSVAYIFKRPNDEGVQLAMISNLAPGIDDGYAAKAGIYSVTPGRIRATVPFVFGTTTGVATLSIRATKRPRGTRLVVEQTLSTNTLLSPISWRFQALSAR